MTRYGHLLFYAWIPILLLGGFTIQILLDPPRLSVPKPQPATICEHDGVRKLCRDTFTQQDI